MIARFMSFYKPGVTPTWHGPYKVDQVLPRNAYMLEELDGVKFPVAVNGQHLKKYFPSMWLGE